MNDNVVFLKYRTHAVEDDEMTFICCKHCRNKTFTVVDQPGGFPLMRCAACQMHIGTFGWAPNDEAKPQKSA
jgi:hypothetical protein